MAKGATKLIYGASSSSAGLPYTLPAALTLARCHGIYDPASTDVCIAGDPDQNVVYARLVATGSGVEPTPFELNIDISDRKSVV
jgi:hypothetical protein